MHTFTYLFLTVWVLVAVYRLLLAVVSQGYSLDVVCGLLLLWSTGLRACGLSCPKACGIFLDRGLNPCTLHCRQIRNHWTT